MFKSWIRWDKHPNSERERGREIERQREIVRERDWEREIGRESIEREGSRKVYG